jgi:GNAT superfamily N-acetyltransferase
MTGYNVDIFRTEMVRLVPMTLEELQVFRERDDRQYAAEQVRVGVWDAGDALSLAKAESDRALPKGLDTPGEFLRIIIDETSGKPVGEVWYSVHKVGSQLQTFVNWIGVHEGHRRRGIATQVLREIENEARKAGASRLGLNLVSGNAPALALYSKLGYTPAHTLLVKAIRPEP